MPVLIVLWFAAFGWMVYVQADFDQQVIAFESRCNLKGGVTLQAYKDGGEWIGCYKDGKELENEEQK